MSLIVATPAYMACDSFLGNEDVEYRSGKKIFILDPLAIGVVGSLSASRIVGHKLLKATSVSNLHPAEVCDYFAKHIDAEYQILVANGKELWESNESGDTFKVLPRTRTVPFGAIGQGYQYSLGAWFTRGDETNALFAGIHYSPMASSPCWYTAMEYGHWLSLRNLENNKDYSE